MKSNGTEYEGSEAQGPSVRNQEPGAQEARDRGQRLEEPKKQMPGEQGAWGLGTRALRTRALGCVYYLICWIG